ncbi:MAG: LamG domain-containing protein [Candidatus Omnitrophica bacterium]|nr:LamG domain-containing protein [Candidatus Omnitrophota bacterium]
MKKIILAMFLFLGCVFVSTSNAELVGHWNFDEGQGTIAHDSSQFANDGSINQPGTAWVEGKYGYALNFFDPPTGVVIPDNASLDLTGTFTIMAWVRPGNISRTIVAKITSGTGFILKTNDGNDKFRIVFWGTGGYVDLFSLTSVPFGQWTHVTATYNGNLVQFYFNGIPDGSFSSIDNGMITNSSPVVIGAINSGGTEEPFVDGTIDEVRIYNHDLTQEEVVADMNNGVSHEMPVADAGRDIVAAANATVILDGSRSYDPDGIITRYDWTRLPDNQVVCSGAESNCETKALGRAEEVFGLKVWDNGSQTATDTMTIINRRVHRYLLSITPMDDQNVQYGNPLAFQSSVEEPQRFGQLEFTLENPPNGAAINSTTGQFSWIPERSQVGVHYITVGVTDGSSFDSSQVKITVKDAPKPPKQPLPLQMVPQGEGN